MDTGFIKLHRKFLDWEWFEDHNTTRLFLYLLLKVNWKSKNWKGMKVGRGQLITSYDHLSKETGLSIQQVRTSIKKLESTGELTRKSTNKLTRLTLCKYKDYQEWQQASQQTKEQTGNKQVTTTKEGKESKEEKKSETEAERKQREAWNLINNG